ncbi:hypothetical protein V2S66_28495 [Streptomyces sp. V4-01]|uniref:Nitroreductase domain-containing protein n=1 Tax=Actinacidiphila polyblastidii TaxID=3110430 RepID=A0ABU7PJ88_9ACTN|nr:hypothetical protein [Streptomyces sp. V4-01]
MTDPLRTALAAAYAQGPGKSLGPGLGAVRTGRPHPAHATALSRLADRCAFGAALAGALTAALAPLRWEPWNPYNDHRAHPSPRCAYLTDAALRIGGDRWAIDPVGLRLEGARPLPGAGELASATVEVTLAPERLTEGYGALRDALALLEAGHVCAALVEAGAAAGLAAHAAPRRAGGPSGVVAEVVFRDGAAPAGPRRPVTAVRSAGLAPRGLSADPRPLPAAVLHGLVEASRPPTGSLAAPPGGDGLRHRLAVRGVRDVPDGLYEPREDGLVLLRPGQATEWVRAAFGSGRPDVDVAGMNVVWAITGAVAAAVAGRGPDAYRDMLPAAGAAAQHVCSAAAAQGLFCRPMRSFDEPAAEAAIRAGAGEDVLCVLLLGRPRAWDFCYDLTDPGDLPWH